MKPFWMVHGEGGREPQKRHETYEAAAAEAERLAVRFPKVVFTVLASDTWHVHRPVESGSYGNPDNDPRAFGSLLGRPEPRRVFGSPLDRSPGRDDTYLVNAARALDSEIPL